MVEQIVSKAIPLWNASLSAVQSDLPPRIELKGDFFDWSRLTEEQISECCGPFADPADDPRPILQPEPGEFASSDFLRAKLDFETASHVDLRAEHGNLQIIIKLASIYLTPEKPAYNGGSWHLEGQLNENMWV